MMRISIKLIVSILDCLETKKCDLCESYPRTPLFLLQSALHRHPSFSRLRSLFTSSLYLRLNTPRTCGCLRHHLHSHPVRQVRYILCVKVSVLGPRAVICGSRPPTAVLTVRTSLACTQSVLAFSLGHGRSALCCDRWCNNRGRYGAQPAPAPPTYLSLCNSTYRTSRQAAHNTTFNTFVNKN